MLSGGGGGGSSAEQPPSSASASAAAKTARCAGQTGVFDVIGGSFMSKSFTRSGRYGGPALQQHARGALQCLAEAAQRGAEFAQFGDRLACFGQGFGTHALDGVRGARSGTRGFVGHPVEGIGAALDALEQLRQFGVREGARQALQIGQRATRFSSFSSALTLSLLRLRLVSRAVTAVSRRSISDGPVRITGYFSPGPAFSGGASRLCPASPACHARCPG